MRKANHRMALTVLFVGAVLAARPIALSAAGDAAVGEALFMNETWNGNGRTCATCHAPDAFFAMTPTYIAGLDPDDSLFVHRTSGDLAGLEFDPGLVSAATVNTVIDPVSNRLRPRGVPSLLGFGRQQIEYADGGQNPIVRLGWDGTAAASLAEFFDLAIRTHMTKTLDRVDGIDFRLPTTQEAEDLEAYVLSLGSLFPVGDLTDIVWANPLVAHGASRYDGLSCYRCHGKDLSGNAIPNEWPIPSHGAMNFSIGTEGEYDRTDLLALAAGVVLYPDEGAAGTFPPPPTAPRAFNTLGLVTAFATEPHFHHHGSQTLTGAVAHYTSEPFLDSPAGVGVAPLVPTDAERSAVVDFLTAVGVVYVGIDSSIPLLLRSNTLLHLERKVTVHDVALAWIRYSAEALEERALHPESVLSLRAAADHAAAGEVGKAIFQLYVARDRILPLY